MTSTIMGIIAAAVLVGSAFLFPWLQGKGIVTFGPRSYTLIVPGTREELLQRSCDALDAARHFSIAEVSGASRARAHLPACQDRGAPR
jgi:hypothetical protein